jgi:hypothetical protein
MKEPHSSPFSGAEIVSLPTDVSGAGTNAGTVTGGPVTGGSEFCISEDADANVDARGTNTDRADEFDDLGGVHCTLPASLILLKTLKTKIHAETKKTQKCANEERFFARKEFRTARYTSFFCLDLSKLYLLS